MAIPVSDGPLNGCGVLVTRPADQAEELCSVIEGAGGDVVRFPVLRIARRDPRMVAAEYARLPSPDIIVFVSRNAVVHGLAAVSVSSAAIAAVGPATEASLEAAGASVDISVAEGFDSETLLTHPALRDVQGRTVLIVRGEDGRELLADTLRQRGAQVHYLAAYRRETNRLPAADVEALEAAWRNGRIDCVTVMSVATLASLLEQLPPALLELLRKTPLVVPGERVLKTACERVPGVPAILASGPGAAEMRDALIGWRHSGINR